MIIEQQGRDIWRGRHRSLHDAIAAGDAGLGVDRILLQRSEAYGVTNVLIVVEEQRRIFVAPLATFFDENCSTLKSNWQQRAHRVVGYEHFMQKYLGPSLHKRRKRASA